MRKNFLLDEYDIVSILAILVNYRDICDDKYVITDDDFFRVQSKVCSKLIKKFMFEIDKGGAK